MHSFALLSVFAGISIAQSTVSLFIPAADDQPLIGSVIGSDATATTYFLQCTDEDNCGFPGGVTLTEGPSTAAYTIAIDDTTDPMSQVHVSGGLACVLSGSPATGAVCVASSTEVGGTISGTDSTTLSPSDITYQVVTLVDNLATNSGSAAPSSTADSGAAPTTTSASPGSTTGTTASRTSSFSVQTTTPPQNGGSSSAPQSSSTSSSHNAAGPAAMAMVTGKAHWALGAVAALAFL